MTDLSYLRNYVEWSRIELPTPLANAPLSQLRLPPRRMGDLPVRRARDKYRGLLRSLTQRGSRDTSHASSATQRHHRIESHCPCIPREDTRKLSGSA